MEKSRKSSSGTMMKTTSTEKFLYGLGDVGSNMIWSFTGSFLTLYYTDSVGMAAAFIGTMMLLTRLLDGVSDILMGIVIEKTHTRWGKARPWILFASVPFALSMFLAFNVPGQISGNARNTYVFITYALMTVVCYTAINLSYHALLPRISQDPADRGVISTVRTFMTLVLTLVLSFATPALLSAFGGSKSQGAWSKISAIYAFIGGIIMIITFLTVKEKVPLQTDKSGKAEKIPVKDAAKAVMTNRYFFLAVIMSVAVLISAGLGAANIYYVRDVLKDTNLYGVMSTASIVPRVVILLLSPMLFKKFGRRNVCLAGCFLTVVSGLLMLVTTDNSTMFLFLYGVRGFAQTPIQVVVFTLAADIVDFGECKTGIRAEGLATSVTSFGMKVGTGLGSALVGWFLAWGNYDAAAAVQPASAITAEIILVVGIPVMMAIIAAICLWFWDLEKKLPEIRKEIEARSGN